MVKQKKIGLHSDNSKDCCIQILRLLIIGGVHKNPGPITREKDQLQIITQNVRGMIEVKKKS